MSLHQPTDASFYSITSLFVNKCRCHRNYLEENKHSHFTNNKYLAIKLLRTMSGSDYSCEFFFSHKDINLSMNQWLYIWFDLIWLNETMNLKFVRFQCDKNMFENVTVRISSYVVYCQFVIVQEITLLSLAFGFRLYKHSLE